MVRKDIFLMHRSLFYNKRSKLPGIVGSLLVQLSKLEQNGGRALVCGI